MKKDRLFLSIDAGGTKGAFSFAFLKCLSRMFPGLAVEGVVGVSIGACIAAFWCTDLVESLSIECLLPMLSHTEPGWPQAARSTYIYDQVCLLFGTRRMRDVRGAALYIVAVNASTGVPVIFSSREEAHGELLLSAVVYASMTIPLYMPLSRIHGETYIDGGFAAVSPVSTTYFLAREHGVAERHIHLLSVGTSTATTVLDPRRETLLSTISVKRLLLYATLSNQMANQHVAALLGRQLLRIGIVVNSGAFDTKPVPRLVTYGYGVCYARLAAIWALVAPFTPPLLRE